MPTSRGGCCTAALSAACCAGVRAGGTHPGAQRPARRDRPGESRPASCRPCAGRAPAPWPPARWTSPAAPATARATAPARGASGLGTSARAPPPHLTATGSVPPRVHYLRLLPSLVPVSSALPFQPIALHLRVPPWLHFRHEHRIEDGEDDGRHRDPHRRRARDAEAGPPGR